MQPARCDFWQNTAVPMYKILLMIFIFVGGRGSRGPLYSFYQTQLSDNRDCGATLKVGELTSDSEWGS